MGRIRRTIYGNGKSGAKRGRAATKNAWLAHEFGHERKGEKVGEVILSSDRYCRISRGLELDKGR